MNHDEDIEESSEEVMEIDEADGSESSDDNCESKVFNPKKDKVPESTELEMDESCYLLYERFQTDMPCLSFDFIEDNLGSGESRGNTFPYELSFVSGSHSINGKQSHLNVVKLSNLHKLHNDEDSENEDDGDDDEDLDRKPDINALDVKHKGTVNRVRSKVINSKVLCSSWSESGKVYIWDISQPVSALNDSVCMKNYYEEKPNIQPIFTIINHKTEGYAMDWSNINAGYLITGDNDANIYLTTLNENSFTVNPNILKGHTKSVEDLQWSPIQNNVFASCSSDSSIRIWDTNTMKMQINATNCHDGDINVISWNRICQHLLISGGDDGFIKVWDLRMFGGDSNTIKDRACTHVFNYHAGYPITSIEWNPNSEFEFAASSEDDQLSLWDVSIEQEGGDGKNNTEVDEYPVQFMFNHMGQEEIKEIHYHQQIPNLVLSTAANEFNVFINNNEE